MKKIKKGSELDYCVAARQLVQLYSLLGEFCVHEILSGNSSGVDQLQAKIGKLHKQLHNLVEEVNPEQK